MRNVAALAKAPRVEAKEIEPYTLDEVQALLRAAAERRNSARWAVALALGLRQGEVLGLRWADIDFDSASLRVRRSAQRARYEHGCSGTCGTKAGWCPKRRRVNSPTGNTKSGAGTRVVGDWVFTTPVGEPIKPNTDYHHWKELVKSAGVPERRLHDARHTAATTLLVLGVPERTVMAIMGWSSTAMAARHQHVTDPIRQDVAKRVGKLLWAEIEQDGEV